MGRRTSSCSSCHGRTTICPPTCVVGPHVVLTHMRLWCGCIAGFMFLLCGGCFRTFLCVQLSAVQQQLEVQRATSERQVCCALEQEYRILHSCAGHRPDCLCVLAETLLLSSLSGLICLHVNVHLLPYAHAASGCVPSLQQPYLLQAGLRLGDSGGVCHSWPLLMSP